MAETVLVIDDEEAVCEFVRFFLERKGFHTLVASDPRTVLPLIEKEKPQVILLDIIMPGIDGLELLRQIREKDKEVKIIMVSGSDNPTHREEAIAHGADGFVKKPLTPEYLEKVVLAKIKKITP